MRKLLTSALAALQLSLFSLAANAQEATYHLPQTAIRMTMLIEKTSYTPGDLAPYARKFLKRTNIGMEKTEGYRIISSELTPYAVPDKSRTHTAHIDQKHNISKLSLSEDNILLGINTDVTPAAPQQLFVPARKAEALDPYKYLSQDILSVGSQYKMAELCAQEIYDIRESKNELTRGQADYMPKDGEQLRIMLANLDLQERSLLQLFEGTTIVDTMQVEVSYLPDPSKNRDILFRFSRHFGMVDKDDLSGEAYYISIEDLKSMPEHILEQGKKAPKDETGVWVVLPGKIRVTVAPAIADAREIQANPACKTIEISAAQYGEEENLNEPLFSKKVLTTLLLNSYNGGIEKIESQPTK